MGMITTEEYAARHGFATEYIRDLCRAGKIPAARKEKRPAYYYRDGEKVYRGMQPTWVMPHNAKIRRQTPEERAAMYAENARKRAETRARKNAGQPAPTRPRKRPAGAPHTPDPVDGVIVQPRRFMDKTREGATA